MADGCDDPEQIDELCAGRAWRRHRGGSPLHAGRPRRSGPLLKSRLSRIGRPLAVLVRPGRHPGRDQLVQGVRTEFVAQSASSPTPDSRSAIELVAKARRLRLPVGEVPDDLARADAGRVELQDVQVAPAVPALVPLRVRTATQTGAACTQHAEE